MSWLAFKRNRSPNWCNRICIAFRRYRQQRLVAVGMRIRKLVQGDRKSRGINWNYEMIFALSLSFATADVWMSYGAGRSNRRFSIIYFLGFFTFCSWNIPIPKNPLNSIEFYHFVPTIVRSFSTIAFRQRNDDTKCNILSVPLHVLFKTIPSSNLPVCKTLAGYRLACGSLFSLR